jgi:hypothetical protein
VHATYLISLLFTTYLTALKEFRTAWRRVSSQHFGKLFPRVTMKCLLVTLNSLRKIQQVPAMYQKFLLFHIYMKLNMFRATLRPSSGAENCTGSIWFS